MGQTFCDGPAGSARQTVEHLELGLGVAVAWRQRAAAGLSSDCQAQQLVGQERVAGQDGALQVGAHDVVPAGTLGLVATVVAGTAQHGAERGLTGVEDGRTVVFS